MAQELNVAMPGQLEIGPTYSVRVTALDATGAVVSAVKVGAVTITADMLSLDTSTGTGVTLAGDWFLVPGPGA